MEHVAPAVQVQAQAPQVIDRAHRDETGIPVRLTKLVKEVRQLGCESFFGTGEIVVVQNWIDKVEETLADLRVADTDRVAVATRLLERNAAMWWRSVRGRYTSSLSWAEFRQEFDDQYYTQHLQDAKRVEFYSLRQGTRTVVEFERELRELAHFVPELDASERLLASRFETGLTFEIRAVIGTETGRDMKTLVTEAIRAEEIVTGRRSLQQKRKAAAGSSSFHHQRQRPRFDRDRHRPAGSYASLQTRQQQSQPSQSGTTRVQPARSAPSVA